MLLTPLQSLQLNEVGRLMGLTMLQQPWLVERLMLLTTLRML